MCGHMMVRLVGPGGGGWGAFHHHPRLQCSAPHHNLAARGLDLTTTPRMSQPRIDTRPASPFPRDPGELVGATHIDANSAPSYAVVHGQSRRWILLVHGRLSCKCVILDQICPQLQPCPLSSPHPGRPPPLAVSTVPWGCENLLRGVSEATTSTLPVRQHPAPEPKVHPQPQPKPPAIATLPAACTRRVRYEHIPYTLPCPYPSLRHYDTLTSLWRILSCDAASYCAAHLWGPNLATAQLMGRSDSVASPFPLGEVVCARESLPLLPSPPSVNLSVVCPAGSGALLASPAIPGKPHLPQPAARTNSTAINRLDPHSRYQPALQAATTMVTASNAKHMPRKQGPRRLTHLCCDAAVNGRKCRDVSAPCAFSQAHGILQYNTDPTAQRPPSPPRSPLQHNQQLLL